MLIIGTPYEYALRYWRYHERERDRERVFETIAQSANKKTAKSECLNLHTLPIIEFQIEYIFIS